MSSSDALALKRAHEQEHGRAQEATAALGKAEERLRRARAELAEAEIGADEAREIFNEAWDSEGKAFDAWMMALIEERNAAAKRREERGKRP